MIWSLQAVPKLTDQQFEQWSKLLEERAGINLGEQQRTFLQTQVSMRMRELGHLDYTQYYHFILDGVAGMVEWSILIDRLVVKETSFFRHRPSIDFVARHVLERAREGSLRGSLDVWSVGCSSGEEPYSLAMVINDAFHLTGQDSLFGITATDISRAALSFARMGIYTSRKLQMVDDSFRQRYFVKIDNDKFQIESSLRDRLCFNQGNVLNINEMPVAKVDVIYCQNLLVYFRRWLRENIMNAFVERLKPGGVLVIGLGEVVDWVHPEMKRLPVDAVQAYIHK